jgi:hypothetical protein
LNGCQYLDRVSLKKAADVEDTAYYSIALEDETLQDLHSHSSLGVSNRGALQQTENYNIRTGTNNAEVVKRDANAAPSTAPTRKATHRPANRAAPPVIVPITLHLWHWISPHPHRQALSNIAQVSSYEGSKLCPAKASLASPACKPAVVVLPLMNEA